MDKTELRKCGPLVLLVAFLFARDEGTTRCSLQPTSLEAGGQGSSVPDRAEQTALGGRRKLCAIPPRVVQVLILDMDACVKLPEGILAERILKSAGISQGHQLLVRVNVMR